MVDASKALVLVAGYAAFMWWRLQMLKTAVRKGRSMGPAWLRRFAASFMTRTANLNGVRLASEGGEGLHAKVPGHFIYVWHPHGFVSYVPSHIMGSKAIAGQPHGTEWFGTCIPLIFNIPFLGEIFQLTNARPVDQKTCESILRNGKGIAIQPGGVKEQAASQHDQEQAFFPSRLGFIRMAIKFGVPLIPVYFFGENQLYKRVNGMEWLTNLIKRTTGMILPIVTAKAGLPMAGLLPHSTDIHIRWGRPVEVGPADENPSEERVQQVFKAYVDELQRVFDANAKDCLPPEVAQKGLKIHLPGQVPQPSSRL